MHPHHASSTGSPNPATVASQASMAAAQTAPLATYAAWTTRRKPTIAELVDDQDALEDWHRNLARLRAQPQD